MTTIPQNTAFRLNSSDKAMLVELARRLERNQSDTIRLLVRGALQILKEQDAEIDPAQPSRPTQTPPRKIKTVLK